MVKTFAAALTNLFDVRQKTTGCPQINFTFLNVNNVRTNIRIATPAIYIDRGHW